MVAPAVKCTRTWSTHILPIKVLLFNISPAQTWKSCWVFSFSASSAAVKPSGRAKASLCLLALVQIWCDPGGGIWCVILSTMQKKRCKICLQARHRAKERCLGTHSILTLWASHPVLRFTPPGTQSSLPRQAHLNTLETFLLWRCWFPSLTLKASLKTDVYSAAGRLFETELASNGGSTQTTMLPVPKGTS